MIENFIYSHSVTR
ncbi:Protein of unknown function [Pyronema omphalodes CBS 100304]|uniref:Uncharacterized protein n=1 Tax=Pyronema omphalodes (strain CBS 100304) TaxID=1076935 RepID=U4KYU9_PYROM|nr:Protein of unknown function [Pyronema omphalodes CBS 100304]